MNVAQHAKQAGVKGKLDLFNVCGFRKTAKILGCNEDYVKEVLKNHAAQRQLF